MAPRARVGGPDGVEGDEEFDDSHKRDSSLDSTRKPGTCRFKSATGVVLNTNPRASEGAGMAPQETCGIPRWRVGLV